MAMHFLLLEFISYLISAKNLGKKIFGFGNSVKRGTQTFSEIVSLNAKIDECKKELANCYSQLGQNYYERNKNSDLAEYQGVFDRIMILNQTIVQCQEQIKIIKGVRQCPNCGANVAAPVQQPIYRQPASQTQQYGQPVQKSEGYEQPIQQPENSEQPT
ncbi:MAG: hypothetical protein HUJ63_02760 [Enterococcus sp.]|nr:hypothetical protein [Enterococcus sp.]